MRPIATVYGDNLAKSTILLVGQQPNSLDRTLSARLACSLYLNTNEQMLHDAVMQNGSGMLPSKQNAFVATKALLATSNYPVASDEYHLTAKQFISYNTYIKNANAYSITQCSGWKR